MKDTSLAHHERHWHYVKARRSDRKNHTTKEILIGQIISVVGALIAGVILDTSKNNLALMVGAFLILPGVFDLGGSIAGAMGARINHRLEMGYPVRKVFRHSFFHAMLLVMVSSIVLGIFGGLVGVLLFDANFFQLLFTTIGASILSGLIGFPMVGLATIIAVKKKVDADNFIGPVETSVFDALTILSIVIFIAVVT